MQKTEDTYIKINAIFSNIDKKGYISYTPEQIEENHNINKLRCHLEREKNGDLIVCVWHSWEINIPATIKVLTANGRKYYVDELSYRKLTVKLLSGCNVLGMADEEAS